MAISPVKKVGPSISWVPGFAANSDYVGVLGTSNTGNGVEGTSGITITSEGPNLPPISSQKAPFPALQCGVVGMSDPGIGVYGSSDQQDAIQAWSNSPQHAGVSARNTSNSSTGNGVWTNGGAGTGIHAIGKQYAGLFDGQLQVNGDIKVSGAGLFASSASPASGVALQATSGQQDAIEGACSSTQGHAGVSGYCNGTGYGVWAKSTSGVGVYGTGGQLAGLFDGKVQVNGDSRVTGTLEVDVDIVLPAADCAEEFDVGSNVDPGTVMVLDDNETLKPCSTQYDKRVAGVVSGAGGYRPGLILDRGRHSGIRRPIALVGKVYCKVDAQYGSVQIGDLLTTSPTPGHAMKATEPSLAFGAVIGKALGRLPEGCGSIPILVALQ